MIEYDKIKQFWADLVANDQRLDDLAPLMDDINKRLYGPAFSHKGLHGSLQVSLERDGICLYGQVLNPPNGKDLVLYGGDNFTDCKNSFIESVDEYLEDRKQIDNHKAGG